MKLKMRQEVLAAALAVVARAVSSKQTIPVLAGVRLQAESGSLVMRATDLSLQIEHRIPVEVEQAGVTVLPARYLTELVKRLPFGDLGLEVAENEVTTIRAGKSKYTIHGFPAKEFPEPAADEGVGVTIGQSVLRDVIRKTAFAVGEDQTRPYLMGVHLQISGGKLLALSTDSVRIAHANVGMNGEVPDIDVIVPARSLYEISRLLADNESEVNIRVNHRAFLVDVGATKVAARLLEGQYPDVMRLLPQKYAGTVRFSKQPFIEACSRAAVIGRNGAVKLAISQDQIAITAQEAEVGQVYEEIPATADEGARMELGFRAELLTEGLKMVPTDDVLLELSGQRGPARILPAEENGFLYVVLPLITS